MSLHWILSSDQTFTDVTRHHFSFSSYRLTFALVPGWQRGAVGHRGGGEIGGGAVHLVGEGAVGQALLLVPLADEARQRELVMGGEAGGVAEALGPRGAVLLDGAGLRREKETGWTPLGQRGQLR